MANVNAVEQGRECTGQMLKLFLASTNAAFNVAGQV